MTAIPPEVLSTANAESRRLRELVRAPKILVDERAFARVAEGYAGRLCAVA